MFSKRRFRRRNKPSSQHFLEGGEQQQETPFIPPVQTKLNIGKPGDIYEVEADKTADAVVAQTNTADAIQKMGAEEEEVQAKPLAAGLTPFVQKQATPEEEEPVQAMTEKEEEEPIQKQEEDEEIQTKEEEEEVQAKSDHLSGTSAQFGQQLKQQKGQGQKLNPKDRVPLENAFGTDFTDVSIHTDGKATAMSKSLNAQAFTHGKDIYFNSGKYNPETKKGKHLLAHELTHTIQQGAIGAKRPKGEQVRNTSNTIQMDKLRYDDRQLRWSDYTGKYQPDGKHVAISDITISLGQEADLVHGKWQETASKSYTLTITYKPSSIELFAIFTQEKSSLEEWITNDEKAQAILGHDSIDKARADLLAHEQVHFLNAKTIAQKYDLIAKAAVPTDPYTEVANAENSVEIESKLNDLRTRMGDELSNKLSEIRRAAQEELSTLQNLYDDDTDHGRNTEQQQNWQNDFDKAMEEAKNPESAEQKKEEPNTDE